MKTYLKQVNEALEKHPDRLQSIQEGAQNIDEVSDKFTQKMTSKPPSFFKFLAQDMARSLLHVYNKKYFKDYGKPYQTAVTYTWDDTLDQLTMYVALLIKGQASRFVYRTSVMFDIDSARLRIKKTTADDTAVLLAVLNKKLDVRATDKLVR